jgi:hypothetical protein
VIFRAARFQIYDGLGIWVENADGNFVARHAGHRIFDVFELGDTCRNIHQRVIGNHCFVHAIEGKFVAFWRPENASVDAKFVAMYGLAVNDALVGFVGDGSLFAGTIEHI